MTLAEIKKAHASGLTVCWGNEGYIVTGRDPENLVIMFTANKHCIGLTHRDQVTLNGKESEFFILTHPMTPAQQAEYDAAVDFGSITPGTPVVRYAAAQGLTLRHGLPNGTLRSAINIWIDDASGESVAVAFSR